MDAMEALRRKEREQFDREYQELLKKYYKATSEVERKAIKRALYSMEVE